MRLTVCKAIATLAVGLGGLFIADTSAGLTHSESVHQGRSRLVQHAQVPATALPAVWFAPLPPLDTFAARPYVGSPDFMQLFTKKAAWPNAARHVSVFKLYGEWVASWAARAQLQRVVTDLKRRHIALAVEAGPLDATTECGQGVEGFAGMHEGIKIANAIKSAGGTLRYVAFDEPFYNAALSTGQNACHWDAIKVAAGVAAYVRAIRTVFPKARFGDIEPLTTETPLARYEEWIDAYRQVTGESLAFFHLDVWYTLPRWPQLVSDLEEFAHSRSVPFGVIYNGDYHDASDQVWLAKAQARFEQYETEGGHPDHAVLQSWTDEPDRVLPETGRTFTNLIRRYSRPRTRLEVESGPRGITGRLLAGGPVAGAPVTVSLERLYEGTSYSPSATLASASTTTLANGRFRVGLVAQPGAVIVARYPGSTRYWPSYASAGTGVGMRNVARGAAVVASAELTTEPAANSVDGDPSTRWGSGQFAPQWIEIDLGAPVAVAAIRLGVDQFPDGNTVHTVLGKPPGGSYRELHVFSGSTTTGDVLEYLPPTPWEGIRYLRIETSASPSWVAWREIEVFAP